MYLVPSVREPDRLGNTVVVTPVVVLCATDHIGLKQLHLLIVLCDTYTADVLLRVVPLINHY